MPIGSLLQLPDALVLRREVFANAVSTQLRRFKLGYPTPYGAVIHVHDQVDLAKPRFYFV